MNKKYLLILLCLIFISCSKDYNLTKCMSLIHSNKYTEAKLYCEKAAHQGKASAQNNLGVMYESGKGVAQNYQKAIEWYQKAADQSYDYAQYNLGLMYYKGKGVAKDYQTAKQLLKQACNNGLPVACNQ